jgi:hypothetical protein
MRISLGFLDRASDEASNVGRSGTRLRVRTQDGQAEASSHGLEPIGVTARACD